MEPCVAVTVAVQNYWLAYPGGHSRFLLQSPIPIPDGDLESGRVLVRHDQGPNNNRVTFEVAQRLVKADGLSDCAYAHGILNLAPAGRDCRRGDPLWIDELASDGQGSATVINLRTWERLQVELGDVRWIPKYRKLDHGDEDELLTLCGAPFRQKSIHVRAIVQRLPTSSYGFIGACHSPLEVRDFVEKDLFEYENLNKLPDGKRRVEEIFDRILASLESPPSFSGSFTCSDGSSTQFSSPAPSARLLASQSLANKAAFLATPPLDDDDSQAGEDDPEFEQDVAKLWSKGMTLIKRRRKPISTLQQRTCNLPAHACPTPPRIFLNTVTRPSHTNRAPTHHHLLDAECPLGARHAIHCVFASAKSRDCIVPFTVRHTCCRPRVFPWNKQIRRPPEMIAPAAGTVVVKGGSGVTVVGGAEEYAELPVEVRPMGFDVKRDADAVGLQMLGLTEGDLVQEEEEEEQSVAGPSSVDVVMTGVENRPVVDLTEDEPVEEPDAFGERQIYGDDDDDD